MTSDLMDKANLPEMIGALAIILLGGLAGGKLAAVCHLPRVTGYLLLGVAIGPSVTELIGLPELIRSDTLTNLRIVSDIALGLILINIGGQCRAENLKRWKQRLIWFSLGEIGTTFVLVTMTAAALNLTVLQAILPGHSLWQTSVYFALFLGVIAIATAPGATLMVVREYKAEGPVTQTALTLVGFNNIVAILTFTVVSFLLLDPVGSAALLLWHVIGPLLLGGLVAMTASVWAQRLESANEQRLLLIGAVFAIGGLARWQGLNPMLAALMFGMVISNSSPRWHQQVEALRQMEYPLYVVFFVLAGANLHLETLGHIGMLGIGYIAARSLGKLLGSRLGARLGGFSNMRGHYTGLTLLAQAGVAIGLAGALATHWPAGGRMVETIVLGSVVIFELIGPLAIRYGLVRAGEVPIFTLLPKRTPQGAFEELLNVIHQFRTSLGIPAGLNHKDPGDILIKHIMRRNVETILDSTSFTELLNFITHSRYDRFPVVDDRGHFIGMINYAEIRNLLFEPSLANLVVASDLASEPQLVFTADQPLRQALTLLNKHHDISYFPVVDAREPKRLLGIISQNDLICAFRPQENP